MKKTNQKTTNPTHPLPKNQTNQNQNKTKSWNPQRPNEAKGQRRTKAVKEKAFNHLYPAVRSYGTWPHSTFQCRASCAAKQQLFWIIKIISTSKSNSAWWFPKHWNLTLYIAKLLAWFLAHLEHGQLSGCWKIFGFILGIGRDQAPFPMGILDATTLEWMVEILIAWLWLDSSAWPQGGSKNKCGHCVTYWKSYNQSGDDLWLKYSCWQWVSWTSEFL